MKTLLLIVALIVAWQTASEARAGALVYPSVTPWGYRSDFTNNFLGERMAKKYGGRKVNWNTWEVYGGPNYYGTVRNSRWRSRR
jgi:hypothetical protein